MKTISVSMASVCALATEGNGRLVITELSIMEGKRSATGCESRDGRGGQAPVPSVMFTQANGRKGRHFRNASQKQSRNKRIKQCQLMAGSASDKSHISKQRARDKSKA